MRRSANRSTVTTETRLIWLHGLAAVLLVGYTALAGLAVSLKFHWPDLMSQSDWLTWGRFRYAHTQGVFFGWLGNAFLAFLYYAVPRLADRPVTSRTLGYTLFFVWNGLLVLPGWYLVHQGVSQGLEWGEFPLLIDHVAVVGLLLACVQFVVPFLRGPVVGLYVAAWYILGGLVFTLFAYPVGNYVPEFEPGARGATYSGLWIHDAIGLYVTPLAVAIAYLVIPLVTRRPIYSHFLSMIGFWLLFLVYPLNGTHHYVFSSIPMDAQKGAIVASVYLGVAVILVVFNLLMSLRGCAAQVMADTPLRFVWVGVVSYLLVSVQGSLQALMPFNRFVHFTDWVIGHAHLALIGFASFLAIGGLFHVWQRLPGFRYNATAANWCFWLLLIGLLLMVSTLTIAGMVQGLLWERDTPWIDSVQASQVYWLIRSGSGVLLLAGFAALWLALTTGSVARQPEAQAPPATSAEDQAGEELTQEIADTSQPTPAIGFAYLQTAYVLVAVAGLGLFVFSFVVLAVWPNQVLQARMDGDRPPGHHALTASEMRGRAVYIREGCGNCHSQLIRSTEADVRRFGIASQAWETEHEFPQLWGTRRIGPDLAREHGKRPADWHLVHLYNPRHVVPTSNMPRYPWLFVGSAREPTQEALDLVAYLESLGRPAALAGLTGPRPLPGLDPEEEKRRGMFCDCAIPRQPGPAVVLSTRLPPSERQRFARRGAEVFARHCIGCHGATGQGDGPAAEALLPRPRDLTDARYSDRALSQILWAGIAGSAMPRWHEWPVNDLRGLVAYVQSLERPVTVEELSPAQRERAESLYRANCATCHGVDADGGGSLTSLAPPATRFREVRPGLNRAESALAEGIPGTAMTSWRGKLSDADRQLLARFVRTLYQGD
jgi:cytochrome c oxidase cbb3-type subunit I/II